MADYRCPGDSLAGPTDSSYEFLSLSKGASMLVLMG